MNHTPLAIHGGTPVRSTPVYYGRQYIDQADCNAVVETLQSDYLTTGPKIPEMERRLCEETGAAYAVAIANGTAALHAACYGADIKQGDEVITTPITFAASANCVLYCGGTPVFADIDPLTYTLSPEAVRHMITDRTKAVIAVDFSGQPAQLDELAAICRKRGLLLIEDASHAIRTEYKGKRIGSIADMTTFSFHPVKTVTGGEGGAITTNDEGFYRRMKLFRTHGITRDPEEMSIQDPPPWYYEQITLGYNYRITDFQAALIISQMDKLDLFARRRATIVSMYDEAFGALDTVALQQEPDGACSVKHLYILRLLPENLTVDRWAVYNALEAEGVVCNVHYIPTYYFPYYQKLGYTRGLCPNAEALYDNILTLPLYFGMRDEDARDVINAVTKVVGYYRKRM